ncbi:MAG: DUF3000 domain-containing protein [Nocardioidaceae bacterium]|jgi:hypothetical protein|nr:DUF3000 domain-containing protein [Nocardioidaceae bacterium]
MAARTELDGPPTEFVTAVEQMRSARVRPEITLEELTAPQRIAPYARAVTADLVVDGVELGTGRLVLLHDPAGNEAWHGTFRCVAFARAEIEAEMTTDPALSAVGWSWLTDALLDHDAEFVAPSGTVTTVASEGFGGMAEDGGKAEIEIRASWTPVGDVASHVLAWADLLCTAAGLPPLPPGVVSMPSRRGRRS